MNIVFLGPPGSGKGTQTVRLKQDFNFVHLSTGDILRSEINAGTDIGNKASEFVKSGKLVPDSLINDILKNKLNSLEDNQNIVFDGYPRNIAQAKSLTDLCNELGRSINKVVDIRVPDTILIGRIEGRFSCKNCGQAYHKKNKMPKQEGVCDVCGSHDLVVRSDDNAEVLKGRLEIFHSEMDEVIKYYREHNLLETVDGNRGIEEVANDIDSLLKLK